MKRALIIIAGVIVILGIGVALYFSIFGSSARLTVGNSPTTFGVGGTAASTASESTGAGMVVAPNLVKITAGPVSAGEVAFDLPPVAVVTPVSLSTSSLVATSSTTRTTTATKVATTTTSYTPGDIVVRYIDRQSGNIYEYRAVARTLTRVSNKTLPGVQEASWLADGSVAFVRFLTGSGQSEHIATYALPYDGNGGYFLQQDLDQAIVTGSSTLFTLANGASGSIGSTAHADGTGVSALFTSPLTSLILHPSASAFIASTRAASELGGYAFTLAAGKFTPIIGPLNGLTVLPSPSGKSLLYSYIDGTTFHMNIFDLATGSVTALPLATLTEKCVWASTNTAVYCAVPTSMTGNLPDSWYQGTTSFTDRIWRIDLSSRLATLILDPSLVGKTDIDAVNLTLDPNSRVLVFRNKKDSSLWAYSL